MTDPQPPAPALLTFPWLCADCYNPIGCRKAGSCRLRSQPPAPGASEDALVHRATYTDDFDKETTEQILALAARLREAERERDEMGNALAREKSKPGGSFDQWEHLQVALARVRELEEALRKLLDIVASADRTRLSIIQGVHVEAEIERARAILGSGEGQEPE